MIVTDLTNGAVSMVSGLIMAENVAPDATAIVEKFGITGAFGLLLWWMLTQLSKKIDENTAAIKEMAQAIREKE